MIEVAVLVIKRRSLIGPLPSWCQLLSKKTYTWWWFPFDSSRNFTKVGQLSAWRYILKANHSTVIVWIDQYIVSIWHAAFYLVSADEPRAVSVVVVVSDIQVSREDPR